MLPAGRVATTTRSLVTCVCSRTASTSLPLPSKSPVSTPAFPEPPDPLSCCGSGCQNCVWIQYADDVSAYFEKPKDDPPVGAAKILNKFKAVKKEMEKHVEDPNLRSYLLMEIKAKLAEK